MSLELRDFRTKVTAETDIALLVESRITGKDQSKIAREILHEWAMKRIHGAKLLTDQLKREGLPRAGEGASGSGREFGRDCD